MFELRAQDSGGDRLGLGAFELGVRLCHVGGRGNPGIVLVLGDAQRFRVGLHRGVEQPLQFVGDAQLQVVARQLALRGQPRIGDVARTGLRGGDIALDGAAHLAPQIGDPAGRRREAEEVADALPLLPPETPICRSHTVQSAVRRCGARAARLGINRGQGREIVRRAPPAAIASAWRNAASAGLQVLVR